MILLTCLSQVVIELEHERYKKLIVEVADPEREVQKIRGGLAGSRA
jgi:hypothetical protein